MVVFRHADIPARAVAEPGRSRLRRVAFPLWLARSRLARRGGRFLTVALGIAAGAALFTGVLAASTLVRDRSLARAVAAIPDDQRQVRAGWYGLLGAATGRGADYDAAVDRALTPLFHRKPVAEMAYRETSFGGHLVDIAGVTGLGRFVHVESGRLPSACRPERCEVVQIAGSGPIPKAPGLNLVKVGTATLTSSAPLGVFYTAETNTALRYHTPATPPYLLAEGVAGLESVPALADIYRSYGWFVPIPPDEVHPWSIASLTRGIERARAELTAASPLFDVTAPTDRLEAANGVGAVGARRLLLLGGEAAAALLAFTILAAAALRRDVDAAWRRLTWAGARGWQLLALTASESALVALGGAIVGWAAGLGLAALLAHELGGPIGGVLAHSALAPHGLVLLAGLAAVAAVVLLLALRAPDVPLLGVSLSVVDVAALGALGAILLALARGSADARSLAAGGGTGAFLLLLPALVALVAAVVAARVLAPALRGLERLGRRGPVALRLAALSLARRSGHAAVAVAFLVVALGLALFASVYRSTLEHNQTAEADFAVPVTAIAREDLGGLVPVLRAAPLERFQALGRAYPVLRLSGDVVGVEGSGFTLLGLPPGLENRRLAASDAGTRGPILDRLELRVTLKGDPLAARAVFERSDGTYGGIALGELDPGTRLVHARFPHGSRLVRLGFFPTGSGLHSVANGGTGVQPLARGTLTIRGLDTRGWIGADGIFGSGARLRYVVVPDLQAVFRPRQPTDESPVPALVSPALAATAGPGGVVPVRIEGGQVQVRVVGTVPRYATAYGNVVLADRELVSTALNAQQPGTGVTNEVWVDGNAAKIGAALRQPPFDRLQVQTHEDVEQALRAEPLARGTLWTLGVAAVAALALALAGLALVLLADLRDEAGELFDLESQGASPSTLRRHLRLRAAAIAGVGLGGGLATGAVLSALVVGLVTLTAAGADPEPPLRLAADWPLLLSGLAVIVVAGAAITALLTRPRAARRLTE
jgi:hypothetical protein